AVRLAPEDFVMEVELSTLLEHNSRGQLFGNGAQLDEAISVFRNVLKTTPESSIRQNLAVALLYAGRYSEAKEEIKRLPASVPQAALSAFVSAATENPARAIIETQSTFPDDQTRAAI